jgi:light-regulated signal transduction histidine kinase (bacteriophytochrome)
MEEDWMAQCEAEPLAYSGAIQPHGGLVCLDAQWRVTHVSAQIKEFVTPRIIAGDALPDELACVLFAAVAKLSHLSGSRCELFAVEGIGPMPLDMVVIRSNLSIVVELIPHTTQVEGIGLEHLSVRPPANGREAQALHEKIAAKFHDLTGFDRVMVYVFREDGDGEVLAEARREAVYGSYLGLRYPGSDIPAIARALYVKNPWRLIPDSHAGAVSLCSDGSAPADLTWSDLRSVSPMHLHYLANMGVSASLSFPIVIAGALWGLIACHHALPRNLALTTLCSAARLARHYSLEISSWQMSRQLRFTDELTDRLGFLRMALMRHGHVLSALAEISSCVLEQFHACGMAVRQGEDWAQSGEVPALHALGLLDEWLEVEGQELINSCDCLGQTVRELGPVAVSGMLAFRLTSRRYGSMSFFIFRREMLHEVEWGGNPHKPVEYQQGDIGVAPRRSFEKWVEKRIGHSSPWQKQDRIAAMRLRLLLVNMYS